MRGLHSRAAGAAFSIHLCKVLKPNVPPSSFSESSFRRLLLGAASRANIHNLAAASAKHDCKSTAVIFDGLFSGISPKHYHRYVGSDKAGLCTEPVTRHIACWVVERRAQPFGRRQARR